MFLRKFINGHVYPEVDFVPVSCGEITGKYIQQGLPVGQFRMLSRGDLGSQSRQGVCGTLKTILYLLIHNTNVSITTHDSLPSTSTLLPSESSGESAGVEKVPILRSREYLSRSGVGPRNL